MLIHAGDLIFTGDSKYINEIFLPKIQGKFDTSVSKIERIGDEFSFLRMDCGPNQATTPSGCWKPMKIRLGLSNSNNYQQTTQSRWKTSQKSWIRYPPMSREV